MTRSHHVTTPPHTHDVILTPTAAMGTAIRHPVPDRVKPSFAIIFDIRAL